MDLRVHLVEKAVLDARVLLGWLAYLESGDSLEGRARKEDEEIQALQDPKDPLANREKEDCKELVDLLDLLVKLEILEILGHRVYLESQVQQE